jgi:hypothetical protein
MGCPRVLPGGMMLVAALAGATPAAAQQIQLTRLADFAFGTVGVDADINSSKESRLHARRRRCADGL